MVRDWLNERGAAHSAVADEYRFQTEDGPELVLTAGAGENEWVLLAPVGPCPGGLKLGELLLLLQANSPFSDLAPVRLTADGAGELLLWVGVRDGGGAEQALDEAGHLLATGHAYFSRLLAEGVRSPLPPHRAAAVASPAWG